MPTSTSIRTSSRLPTSRTARSSSSQLRGSSTATVKRPCRLARARARILSLPPTWLAIKTSSMPARLMTIASQTVAVQTPMAPASTCMKCELGTFMNLDVRAKPRMEPRHLLGHESEVAPGQVQVQDQGRRGQVASGPPEAGRIRLLDKLVPLSNHRDSLRLTRPIVRLREQATPASRRERGKTRGMESRRILLVDEGGAVLSTRASRGHVTLVLGPAGILRKLRRPWSLSSLGDPLSPPSGQSSGHRPGHRA